VIRFYVRIEAVVLIASMELVGKPVWVEISAAESEILEIVVWLILNCLLGPYLSHHRSGLLYCRVSGISGAVEWDIKSGNSPSTSVSNLRNQPPIGTLTVLLCLSATVVLTFEVRYLPFTLDVKLVRDGPR